MTKSNFNFDSLLEPDFQSLSSTFWTPLDIIQKTLVWLDITDNSRVLDIGSGVGKFCITGNVLSEGQFTGVEIRKNLISESERIAKELQLKRVQFIHADIKEVDLSQYNSFFYYNPFCEHLAIDEIIDDTLDLSRENHSKYEEVISEKLNLMPSGTKVVTYNSNQFIFPSSYRLIRMDDPGELILWKKE